MSPSPLVGKETTRGQEGADKKARRQREGKCPMAAIMAIQRCQSLVFQNWQYYTHTKTNLLRLQRPVVKLALVVAVQMQREREKITRNNLEYAKWCAVACIQVHMVWKSTHIIQLTFLAFVRVENV